MLKKLDFKDGKLFENNDEKSRVYIYANPDKIELNHLIENYKIDEHT